MTYVTYLVVSDNESHYIVMQGTKQEFWQVSTQVSLEVLPKAQWDAIPNFRRRQRWEIMDCYTLTVSTALRLLYVYPEEKAALSKGVCTTQFSSSSFWTYKSVCCDSKWA